VFCVCVVCIVCWALPQDYRIGSNFWKFYRIKTDFTLVEPVFLVKCLDYFDWNGFFWCSECGHSREMYNILFIGRASVFVVPCFWRFPPKFWFWAAVHTLGMLLLLLQSFFRSVFSFFNFLAKGSCCLKASSCTLLWTTNHIHAFG